jgi:hypothetical protein
VAPLFITLKDRKMLQRSALTSVLAELTNRRTGSRVGVALHLASMVMAVQQDQGASGGWLAW